MAGEAEPTKAEKDAQKKAEAAKKVGIVAATLHMWQGQNASIPFSQEQEAKFQNAEELKKRVRTTLKHANHFQLRSDQDYNAYNRNTALFKKLRGFGNAGMDYSHFCAFLTAMEDGVTFSLAAALWTNLEKQEPNRLDFWVWRNHFLHNPQVMDQKKQANRRKKRQLEAQGGQGKFAKVSSSPWAGTSDLFQSSQVSSSPWAGTSDLPWSSQVSSSPWAGTSDLSQSSQANHGCMAIRLCSDFLVTC
ncbi:unnamed protein product, partial [Symbiodinium natans]